ncbi:hypothetical protein LXL04_005111 [Taraxacum kok-saghyz]
MEYKFKEHMEAQKKKIDGYQGLEVDDVQMVHELKIDDFDPDHSAMILVESSGDCWARALDHPLPWSWVTHLTSTHTLNRDVTIKASQNLPRHDNKRNKGKCDRKKVEFVTNLSALNLAEHFRFERSKLPTWVDGFAGLTLTTASLADSSSSFLQQILIVLSINKLLYNYNLGLWALNQYTQTYRREFEPVAFSCRTRGKIVEEKTKNNGKQKLKNMKKQSVATGLLQCRLLRRVSGATVSSSPANWFFRRATVPYSPFATVNFDRRFGSLPVVKKFRKKYFRNLRNETFPTAYTKIVSAGKKFRPKLRKSLSGAKPALIPCLKRINKY